MSQVNLYKTLFDESIIPMGIIAPIDLSFSDFEIVTANQSFLKISGLKSSNLPANTHTAFAFLKGFSNSVLKQIADIPGENPTQILYQNDDFYFRLTLKKIHSYQLTFTIENITELNLNRIELADKKRQLRESQEIARLGYWIENHETGQNYWSDQVYSILGIPVNDLVPSFANYLKFVYHEDYEKVTHSYSESIVTKSGIEFTHRLSLLDDQLKYVNLRCYTNYNSNGNPSQTIGILQDVSSIEITKDELRKSETIFRSIFENAPIAIVLVNQEYKPIYANPQFSDITGYPMEEVLKKGLKDFTFPDDFENNNKQYSRLFKNEISSFSLSKRYVQKNGGIIWVKIVVSAIKDINNNTTSAIAMVQDISAEKKASEALVKSEYKYRTTIENANDGIGLFDLNFKPIIYNSALYEMLGYNLEEYLQIDHNKFELFHADDIHLGQESLLHLKENTRAKIEAKLRNKNGEYQYFSINYIPVQHEEKPAILIFRRDITQRKNAELQNEEYRSFLETIMENLPVLFFAKTTPDFRYLYWNNAAEQITGISADEALGKTDFELQTSKQLAEKYYREDEKLLKTKKKLEIEHEFTNSLGEIKHFKTIKTLHQSPSGTPLILGLSMDISQLKEAEQQIEQSTQMLKEAQKIAKLGYWEYDVAKDLFFDNAENRQILGIDKLHYFLNASQFKELLLPEEKDEVMRVFYNCINTNTSGEGIIRIQINNEIRHIAINYRPIASTKSEVIKLRGTCLDITYIRQSEMALRESEKRLKQAEHLAKVGYWDHNYISKITHFSNEVWNILEMPLSNSEIIFSDFINNVHPEDKTMVYLQFEKATHLNQSFNFDFRIVTQNQNLKYIKALGTFVKSPDGSLLRSIGTFQDVTDIRIKELKLQRITENLIQIQKLSKTGFIEIYKLTGDAVLSDSIADLLEIPQTDSLNLSFYQSLILEEDKLITENAIQKTIHSKTSQTIQYRIKLPTGKIKYINEICHVSSLKPPSEISILRIIQDITQMKTKELELSRWGDIKKTNLIGSWEYTHSNQMYNLTPEASKILEIDPAIATISVDEWIQLIHEEDKFSVKLILTDSLKNFKNFTLTYRIITPISKSIKYIQDSSNFYKTENGPSYQIGTIRDISQIRNTEQQLIMHNELLKVITENSTFIIAIVVGNKHLFVNNKWGETMGLNSFDVVNKLEFNQIFKPETTRVILEIFLHWKRYEIKEFRNELLIKPIHAPEFSAEIFIKEIYFNEAPAFIILATIIPKTEKGAI